MSLITRVVTLDRSQPLATLLDSIINRHQIINKAVIVPTSGIGVEEVEVCFFQSKYWLGDSRILREYAQQGIAPDPYAVIKVNSDPEFAMEYHNAAQWGESYVLFRQRNVLVERGVYGGVGGFWMGGVKIPEL